MAAKKKDVTEMLGEFFREAAVLVLVFYPIEQAKTGATPFVFTILVGILCIVLLVTGIVFEKLR